MTSHSLGTHNTQEVVGAAIRASVIGLTLI
jgi:hypothetical protein